MTKNEDPTKPVIEAGHRLGKYLLDKQQSIERLLSIRCNPTTNAPGDYASMLAAWKDAQSTGLFPVSSENMAWTIFGSDIANHAFRFWHDILHCTHERGFDLKSELYIGGIHCEEIKRIFGGDSLEARIMEADTIGQTMYEAAHGRFPKQQTAFAVGYVLQGAGYALSTFIDVL